MIPGYLPSKLASPGPAFIETCTPYGLWLSSQCTECNGVSDCRQDGDTAACAPRVCCFPESRCDGQVLEICNADSSGWEPLQDCGAPLLCNSLAGVCETGCLGGATRCNGTTLLRCNDDRTGYEAVEECPAGCGLGSCIEADAGAAP